MLAGREMHAERAKVDAVPPVHFRDVGDAAFGEPRADAERHQIAWPLAGGGQSGDGRFVEVVVVIVGDQDQVDARQFGRRQRGRHPATGTQPGIRAGMVGQLRVDQNVLARHLQQHRGMPQPGDLRAGIRLRQAHPVDR